MGTPSLADRAGLEHTLALQCDVITRRQLLAGGVSQATIQARVRAGRWQRVYDGVYLTKPSVTGFRQRAWAGVLAGGAGAVASHGTAAALLGLRPAEFGPITISLPLGRQPRRRSGLIVHRRRIDPMAWRSAPPCTSPVDTLLDLVGDCREAGDVTGLVTSLVGRAGITSSAVSAEVCARPMMRWRRLVLDVTSATADGVRSPLEHRYRRDVEIAHGLPRPARQVAQRAAGRRVVRDLEYETWGVVVELDGRLNHADTERVMRDMARDNAVTVTGRATLRYGWREVAGRPCRVAGQVADVLSARGWSGAVHRCGPTCQL